MNQKYLIISGDDFGLCSSVNRATIKAYKEGCLTSISIMAPAPAFDEAIELAKKAEIKTLGVHLTLTSEFSTHRWGPVTGLKKVSSLVDRKGSFHQTAKQFAKFASTEEISIELQNQIKKVLSCGIQPTHLDCHMFVLHRTICGRTDLKKIILDLCRKYRLPFRCPFSWENRYLRYWGIKTVFEGFPRSYDIPASRKAKGYGKILDQIKSGVSELILHCGYDNYELKQITKRSARRQADFDYAMSSKTLQEFPRRNICLISWKQLAGVRAKS